MKPTQIAFFGLTLIALGSILMSFYLLKDHPYDVPNLKGFSYRAGYFLAHYINLVIGVTCISSGIFMIIKHVKKPSI